MPGFNNSLNKSANQGGYIYIRCCKASVSTLAVRKADGFDSQLSERFSRVTFRHIKSVNLFFII